MVANDKRYSSDQQKVHQMTKYMNKWTKQISQCLSQVRKWWRNIIDKHLKVKGRSNFGRADPGLKYHLNSVFIAYFCFLLCFLHTHTDSSFFRHFFLEAPSLHLTELATLFNAKDRILEKNQLLMTEKDTLLVFQIINSVIKEMISWVV